MGYTKRLPQLKHGVLFHLKIENLEPFLTIIISYFSFIKVCEKFGIYHYIKGKFNPF